MLLRKPAPLLTLALLAAAACADSGAVPSTTEETSRRDDIVDPAPLDRSVRFVWFVPTDVPYDDATVEAIERAAYNTRSWYRALLDGTTFRFDEAFPVEVVFGDHARIWYEERANPFGWDPVWNANYWVDMEVKAKLSLEDWSPRYKVAIYMSAEGGGGSSVGRVVVPQHDVDGIEAGERNVNRFWGGMAHELGHAFDLPDADGDDGTIMSGALYAYPDADLPEALESAMLGSERNAGYFADVGPAFDPGASYAIVNAATGLVVDLPTGDPADGVPVVASAPTGADTQRWTLERRDDGTYRIRNVATRGLLVVAGRSGAAGARIVQAADGDPLFQAWYVLAVGRERWEVVALHAIVPNERAGSLALPDGAGAGTGLVQEDFVTADRQLWSLEKGR